MITMISTFCLQVKGKLILEIDAPNNTNRFHACTVLTPVSYYGDSANTNA